MAEFGFGNVDLELINVEAERLSNKGGGSNNFMDQFVPMPNVKPGATGAVSVRILPPLEGKPLFQYNRTHKINGRSIQCPRPLVRGKWDYKVACPICEYYSSLWKQIEKLEKAHGKDCPEADPFKEEARGLKPVPRYYYNAIVRSLIVDGKEEKNVGPRILSVGEGLHNMIIRAMIGVEGDEESKLGNIASLTNGWDFIIRKTVTVGADNFPKYDTSSFSRSQSPAGTPEEIARWAESLHDLTKLRNPKDVNSLERELAIHRGLIPDETTAMDINAFDSKWGTSANAEVSVEAHKLTSTPSVVVPETISSAPSAEEVAKSIDANVDTVDVGVPDDDYFNAIKNMNI